MPEQTIAERLRALRTSKDEKQDVVAEACDISRVALARYETGQREPRMQIAARLADYYGVSVDYILGREDPSVVLSSDVSGSIETAANLLPQEKQADTKKDAQSAEFDKLWDRMSEKERSFILSMMRTIDKENNQ